MGMQIQIQINGKHHTITQTTLMSLKNSFEPDADITIINGFATGEDMALSDGDLVFFIRRGVLPSETILESLMSSRHSPAVHGCMKGATVGIAGVGGLGSHVAMALGRMGVGKMILVDFDVVEPSNLNRQAYFVSHLGMAKVEAMADLVRQINPYVKIEIHQLMIEENQVVGLFETCDVVVEAFDNPKAKAMLVETLLSHCGMPIVAASGLAGLHSSNSIQTKRPFSRLYTVGDGENGAKPNEGLMAPRVMVAAAHQANMVARLLIGELNP